MKILNCCMVCYKIVDYSPSSTQNKNEECVTARFIRLFQKHVRFSLESTQLKIRNSSLTFLSRNESHNESIQFQVCETCSRLLSSFNSSYRDLKCAETRANWSLQQIANVIHFADYAPARRAKVRESLHDLEEDKLLVDNAVEIISKFRKQLQHKCRVWYKNQFSRVVLMKTNPGEFSPENRRDCENPGDELFTTPAAKSKSTLIATALINLSSFQLVLYLALFNPDLMTNMDSSIPYTETSDRLQEPKNNFKEEHTLHIDQEEVFPKNCLRKKAVLEGDECIKPFSSLDQSDNHSKVKLEFAENSPQFSPPSPNEEEWDPGDGDCSTSDPHNIPNASQNFLKLNNENETQLRCIQCGCGKQLEPNESLNHECQRPYIGQPFTLGTLPLQGQFVIYLKQDDGIANDQADDQCDSSREAPGASFDNQIPTVTEDRPPEIEHVTTQSCIHCQLKFHSLSELEQHLPTCSNGTLNTPEPVNVCRNNVQIQQESIKIPNKIKTKLSKKRLSGSRNKYVCGQCATRCKDLATLNMHKLKHAGPEGKYSCSYCEKKFVRNLCMKRHLRTHTGERPFKCSLDNCQSEFQRKDHLQVHQKRCHKNSCTTEVSMETQT